MPADRPDAGVRLLLLGDICGEPGRTAVERALPGLKQELALDFVVANCENAAGGYGITPRLAESLFAAGIDCLTGGDHIFDRRDALEYIAGEKRLLRPFNYPPAVPGRGCGVFETGQHKIGILNLMGRVFMRPVDCPFRTGARALDMIREDTRLVVVDFHAEATAEKQGLGWFLDGRASAVLGTHTHVQTADQRVLPGGTAYTTDVGMCGAFDSVLGMQKEPSLRRLTDVVPARLRPASGDIRINGAVVEIDADTGLALSIERLERLVPVEPAPDSQPVAESDSETP